VFGCSSVPRREPSFAVLAEAPDPAVVLRGFRERSPKRFTERQTAVVDSKRGKIAALGICSFDKPAKRFALALMTPAGVKLLQIEKNGKETSYRFYLPGVSPGGKAAERIAEDAWRIYSHPDSPPDSREIRADRLVFTWRNGTETERLVFGRSPGSRVFDLKTKSVFSDGAEDCVIDYFDYRGSPDGTRRPARITYWNRRFDYFLTIKNSD
jgi:hypothetical protein